VASFTKSLVLTFFPLQQALPGSYSFIDPCCLHVDTTAITMTAASPAPSQLQAVPASVTDDAAFEAFASCRFQEAARLAAEELAQQKEPRRDDSQATTLKRPTKGVPLPCPLSDGFLEKKGGKTCILIELHEHCAR
jgi:hypothetical protein